MIPLRGSVGSPSAKGSKQMSRDVDGWIPSDPFSADTLHVRTSYLPSLRRPPGHKLVPAPTAAAKPLIILGPSKPSHCPPPPFLFPPLGSTAFVLVERPCPSLFNVALLVLVLIPGR
ncbi:hypothetical protein LY76DRAFT_251719 [Colletotrichum caudatum]|nr:hypothetical protein LY76DRAFT_251719 [Colletotrichum caudatum]